MEYTFLKNMRLFEGFTDDELQKFFSVCSEVEFPSKILIFNEGDTGTSMFIIVEGKIEIVLPVTSDKKDYMVDLIGLEKWGIFGEFSYFKPGTRSASAKTVTNVKLLKIEYSDIDEFITQNKNAGINLLKNFGVRFCEIIRKEDEFIRLHCEYNW